MAMASTVLDGLRASNKGKLNYDRAWYEEGRIQVSKLKNHAWFNYNVSLQ